MLQLTFCNACIYFKCIGSKCTAAAALCPFQWLWTFCSNVSFVFSYQTPYTVSVLLYSGLFPTGTQLVQMCSWDADVTFVMSIKLFALNWLAVRRRASPWALVTRVRENMCVCEWERQTARADSTNTDCITRVCVDCVRSAAVQGWYCTLEIAQIRRLTSALIHTAAGENSLSPGTGDRCREGIGGGGAKGQVEDEWNSFK